MKVRHVGIILVLMGLMLLLCGAACYLYEETYNVLFVQITVHPYREQAVMLLVVGAVLLVPGLAAMFMGEEGKKLEGVTPQP